MGLEQKYKALDFIVRRLLADRVERSVARIVLLLGSLMRDESAPENTRVEEKRRQPRENAVHFTVTHMGSVTGRLSRREIYDVNLLIR